MNVKVQLTPVDDKLWLLRSCDHSVINVQGKSILNIQRMGFFEIRSWGHIFILFACMFVISTFDEPGCCGEKTNGSCSVRY